MDNTPDSDGPFRLDRNEKSSGKPQQGDFAPFDRLPLMVFETDPSGKLTNANERWLRTLRYDLEEVIGRPLEDFVTDGLAALSRSLPAPSEAVNTNDRDLPVQLVRSDGTRVEAVVSAEGPGGREREESVVYVAAEVTSRQRAETIQASLVGICQAANSTANLVTFLDAVRHQLGRLMDTTGLYLVLYDQAADRFTVPYRYDRGIARHQGRTAGTISDLDRLVINELKPSLIDCERHQLLVKEGLLGESAPSDFRSWMGVPLRTRRGTIGLMGMSTYAPREAFSDRHLEYLSYVAEHVALNVDRLSRKEWLRQSEERYRLIFDRAVSVIALVDPDGTIVDCNRRTSEATGYEPEELIGQPMSKIVHPNYLRKAEASLKEVLTKGASAGCDFKMMHRDGHELDVVVYSSGLTDAGGDYVRTICVIDDITQRRQTEEALRVSEETNRALFIGCGDAIAIHDLNDVILAVNPAMEKLFGYCAEELIGRRFPGMEGIDDGKFLQWVRFCRTGEAVSNYETARPHKSGPLVPVSITVSPVISPDGSLRALSFFYRDLSLSRKTDLKLAEMQQLNSLALLAAGIAHDFNNILTAILGNIDLAKLDVDSDNEAYDRLTDAEAALVRAQSLTHQLLTFSKGGAPIRTTAAIPEIIADSAGFALTGSRTKCEFDFAEDLKPVEVDRGQFSQVIHNLIINADQSMPNGGVVRIKADNLEVQSGQASEIDPGQYIRISISDHGVGIPDEYIKRVFEPFFTTKRTGNGLGLATSFSIIKRHDGHIDIESEVGRGTTFNIYLPASRGVALQQALDVAEELPLVLSGRALVMDDEETVRQVAESILSRLGFKTDSVADGLEAVERFEQAVASGERYDLVVLDLTVPGGMGAEETIRRLKEIDPRVKAIVASGYANDRHLIEHKRYGFAEYIVKPFRVQEIRRTVRLVTQESVSYDD